MNITIKVLLVYAALPHYFRDFCNHLSRIPGLTLVLVNPSEKGADIGDAVHESTACLRFTRIALKEVQRPPRRLLGMADFEIKPSFLDLAGLPQVLCNYRPDIVVFAESYQYSAVYNKALRGTLRAIGSKVVFASLPFMLPSYPEAVSRVPCISRIPLRSSRLIGSVARLIALDRLYARFVRNPSLRRHLGCLRKVFCAADAHAVYHDEGVSIYESYGVPRAKIHVVRNSPDTDRLIDARRRVSQQMPSPTSGALRLVHVGRLVRWKRVDMLIRAVSALRISEFPKLELAIVGYGPCQEELQALAQSLGVEEAVQFLGGIYEEDDLARCFLGSSMYVLAGMGGLSINEAMCFGLPVICSRCDGTERFLVRPGYNGYIFQEGDLQDLTEKIALILRDDALRRNMGRRSLEIIENEINIHVVIDNYLRVFRALVHATGKR